MEAEVEFEVEEEELLQSWGKVDVVDGEFDIAFCARSELDEIMVFMIKIPDPEPCPPLPYFIQRPRPPPPPSILNHIKGVKKKKITTNNNSSCSFSFSFTPKKISPVSKVANVLELGDSNSNTKGHYIAYDVISRSWNLMFNEPHLSWAEEVQCKRAQVVSTTLYWPTRLTEDTDMIFISMDIMYIREGGLGERSILDRF